MKPLLLCFYSYNYENLSFCSDQIFSYTKNRKKNNRENKEKLRKRGSVNKNRLSTF